MGNCCNKEEKQKTLGIVYLPIYASQRNSNFQEDKISPLRQTSTLHSGLSNHQYASELFKNIIMKEQCVRCSQIIDYSPISAPCGAEKCESHFHKECFEKHINNLVIYKQALHLKCYCGHKIPTSLIRNSSIINKMELLGIVFTNQVKMIPNNHQVLRHDKETLEYMKIEIGRRESDFILVDSDNEIYKEF